MIWDNLKRHQEQVEMFRRAIARGRMAQAYLFVGPRGIGKREFARRLTQCLFCKNIPDKQLDACGQCSACKQVRAGTHPDLLTLACPPGKKDLPMELMVGAPERRGREGLCHDLSLRPMSAGRRIAIIDDAELMNEASANALLKTLEEPPPGAVLFLMTPDTEPILPTIRSRCQPLRFSPLTDDELTQLLLEQGIVEDARHAADVAALAGGSLETAQELLGPQLHELYTLLMDALAEQPVDALPTVRRVLEIVDELGGETADKRRRAGWVVRFATEGLRKQFAGTASADDLERLGLMMDRCLESDVHLKQAMPVPLCLEGLFHDLGRISREGG